MSATAALGATPRTPAILGAVALVLGACSPPTRPEVPTDSESALTYRVSIDDALETMQVSVCPGASHLPAALVPIHAEAAEHLRAASLVDDDRVSPLVVASTRLDLSHAPPTACVRYTMDLATCFAADSSTGCARVGRDLFAPTSVWLLAPETRVLAAHYDLSFDLPEGIFVTPIAEHASSDDAHVVLDDRSFEFVTYLAFTRSPPVPIAVPGACIDVVTLDARLDASMEARARWLAAATGASASVTGHAPFDRLTALIVPTMDVPGTPVLFGVAGRGMRPTVTLLVSEHATEAELVPDWTAVHELSHFLTAYVEGEDTWLSEGLATYYEEVLRARAGLITETEAWTAIERGIAHARAECAHRTLRGACTTMHEDRTYACVYWGGAALVLLADVAYRQAAGSLDEAIARAWERRTERATGAELLAWLDGAADGPFASIAARWLDSDTFPDVEAANEWLGIHWENDVVTLSDDAPGAAVRRAITMNERGAPPSNPSRCATNVQ